MKLEVSKCKKCNQSVYHMKDWNGICHDCSETTSTRKRVNKPSTKKGK